jgi:hypothetical protein
MIKWENIQQAVKRYGIENVKFYVPMTPLRRCLFICYKSSADKEKSVPCTIKEEWNREVKTGYKVKLHSLIPGYGYEDFYCGDLVSGINSGYIKMKIGSSL